MAPEVLSAGIKDGRLLGTFCWFEVELLSAEEPVHAPSLPIGTSLDSREEVAVEEAAVITVLEDAKLSVLLPVLSMRSAVFSTLPGSPSLDGCEAVLLPAQTVAWLLGSDSFFDTMWLGTIFSGVLIEEGDIIITVRARPIDL